MEGYAKIAGTSGPNIPIDSVGMDFLASAAGDATLAVRKLRQEFETAEAGGAA